MELAIRIAQLLLSLSILIAVHEAGHFFAARMFNIKVEKFYLFFDFLFPMANVLNFSLVKFKKGDTEYGIGWFPLGGYVKIAGMVDESMDKEQLKAPAEPWEFRSKPAWQRLIVMLGGIIVNVVVGIVIFIGIVYYYGDKFVLNDYVNNNGGVQAGYIGKQIGFQTGDKVIKINGKEFEYFDYITKPDALLGENSTYTVLRDGKEIVIAIPTNFIENFDRKEAQSNFVLPRIKPEVEEVEPKTIASKVGLLKGDVIVELQHQPVKYFDEVREILKTKFDTMSFKVLRGSETLSFNVPTNGDSIIGFRIGKLVEEEGFREINYSLGQSILLGPGRAFDVVFNQVRAIRKIILRQLSLSKSISSPIGMVKMFQPTWDWESFWRMTGILSMVLAFMNLLPIPALDGGYVVFLLYEMISGRAPSEKFFENAIKVGMALLLILMVYGFTNDIIKEMFR
jgi:regulator of sigma E protease